MLNNNIGACAVNIDNHQSGVDSTADDVVRVGW